MVSKKNREKVEKSLADARESMIQARKALEQVVRAYESDRGSWELTCKEYNGMIAELNQASAKILGAMISVSHEV